MNNPEDHAPSITGGPRDRAAIGKAAPDTWLKSGEYLPAFMRDFHDQKDLFKALQDVVERQNEKDSLSATRGLNWIAAHVYTVDVFLWCLARRGWTLQRSRKPLAFSDIHEFVGEAKRVRDGQMSAVLRSAFGGGAQVASTTETDEIPGTPQDTDLTDLSKADRAEGRS